MGLVVSMLEGALAPPLTAEPAPKDADAVDATMATVARNPPTYIAIPSPYFATLSLSPSPSHRLDDPFASPMLSPPLTFYTAPSSPIPSPMAEDTVLFQYTSMDVHSQSLQSPIAHASLQLSIPAHQFQALGIFPSTVSPTAASPKTQSSPHDTHQPAPSSPSDTDDAFPLTESLDIVLDEDESMESLNPLEKIYLYSISKATYHRIFICQDLPNLLELVTPQEAVEYVIPLLDVLSKDQEESVREALTSGLAQVIWWFLMHCPLEERTTEPPPAPAITFDAFTPILGRLVLSPSPEVGGSAKAVIVDILQRIRETNREEGRAATSFADASLKASASEEALKEPRYVLADFFDKEKRTSFEHEILGNLIVGLENMTDTESGVYDYGDDDEEIRDDEDIQSWNESVVVEDSSDSAESMGGISPSTLLRTPDLSSAEQSQKPDSVNPYFPVLPAHAQAMANNSPASSTASSTPSSTNSTTSTSSESPSPDDFTPPNVQQPVPVLAPPPVRANPLYAIQSPRSSTPPYVPFASRSPKTSPLHQINDPFSLLSGTFLQRSASPASQFPPTIPRARSPQVQIPPQLAADVPGSEETLSSPNTESEDQAAVKRMTSVNLMTAVTSQGCIETSSQITFLQEIKRFAADPVPWVRRESSFAIGALAKTVPDELIHMSLLPLLENLLGDAECHVRHSSLFALPSVLSRLPLKQRQTFALHAANTLAMDSSPEVRAGLLETLGEIIYTFHDDEFPPNSEPPDELITMFIGRRNDTRRTDDGQLPFDRDKAAFLNLFYKDASRPLICAFNFPAVTKTLGRSKWDSTLREMYIHLSNNPAFGVRRTLAASVGDLAKILGPDIAERDLMGVWRDSVNGQDDEIRMKTVDCLGLFFPALGPTGRLEVLEKVLEAWIAGRWKGWRERETIVLTIVTIIGSIRDSKLGDVTRLSAPICGLVIYALADAVSAVRDAAISGLPFLWSLIRDQPDNLQRIRLDIRSFAQSTNFRRRMTYVSCQQCLLLPSGNVKPLLPVDDEISKPLWTLARDPIVGVRIGVARLVNSLFAHQWASHTISPPLVELVNLFSQETSREVLLYVPDPAKRPDSLHDHPHDSPSELDANLAIFSRPPCISCNS